MRIYMAHALNFNAGSKGKKTEVIPGGLALLNLKKPLSRAKFRARRTSIRPSSATDCI
jgi:hypothetical protein